MSGHTPIHYALRQLMEGATLNAAQAAEVFAQIMAGEASDAQIGALLMGLSCREESPEVLEGAARAMREASVQIQPQSRPLLDTCGTGGDGASTFNISTASAIVVAAAGQAVAKHGNRAVSSKSGSADVLEALGVNLSLSPEDVADCVDEVGIGFMFAPGHHPAMKHAIGPRRELALRTVFNLLGPLTNPAGAEFQVLGVYARDKLMLMAQALQSLGVTRALLVHGQDGLDEITTSSATDAVLVEAGEPLREFTIEPQAFGVPMACPKELAGGDVEENAAIIRSILAGETGSPRDIVLLNAAAALWVCGKAGGIAEGLGLAASAIDDGRALKTLEALAAFSHSYKK